MATVKAVTVYKLENENEEPRCLGRILYCGDDHLSGFRAFLEGNKENPIFPWPFDFWDSQVRTRIAAELEQYNTLDQHDHAVFFIRSHGQQFSIAGTDILEPGTASKQSSSHAAAQEPEQKDTSPFIASSSTTGPVACAPNSSLRENDSHEEPSCPTLQPRHKVFLSHSGTQKTFVAELCKHLEAHNVYPFFDQRSDSLPKGEKFSTLILDAGRKCRVAVVVLSEEYLSSKWPMLELAEFVCARRSENKNLNLLPLFYKASVGDLSDESIKNKWRPRWMKLVGSGDARVDLEDWTRALRVLRGINGPSFEKFGNSNESYRDAIVKEIFRLAPPDLLYDTSKIFGWSRICEILAGMFLLHTKTSAQVLGLYGMGGLGKSTMSKSLCNYFNQEFLGRVCYIEMKEGVDALVRQQEVIRKLLGLAEPILQQISDASQGWGILRGRLKENPVLLIIDNINLDDKEEAQDYLNIKYNSLSKIMVVSRSLVVVEKLLGHRSYCCKIPCLERHEAVGILLQHGGQKLEDPSLSEEERGIVEGCVEEACFQDHDVTQTTSLPRNGGRQYHPLAIKALGAYLEERSENCGVLSWPTYLDEYRELKGSGECYDTLFKIVGLQFSILDKMTQSMYLNIVLHAPSALVSPMLSNSPLEDMEIWLANIHEVGLAVVKQKIAYLRKSAMLNIERGEIVIHDIYKEYVKRKHDINIGGHYPFFDEQPDSLQKRKRKHDINIGGHYPFFDEQPDSLQKRKKFAGLIIEGAKTCQESGLSNLIGDNLVIDLSRDLLSVSPSGFVIRTSFVDGHGVSQACILKRCDVVDQTPPDLARLQHPHVVHLMGFWIEEKYLFLVMEVLDGDLAKLILRTKSATPLSLHVAVDLMLQIAEGMLYFHEMGVSYSLKCDNVLYKLTDRNKTEAFRPGDVVVKLGGFGCSRPAHMGSKSRDVLDFGQTCLEILTGDKRSDKTSIPETTPSILKDLIVRCLDMEPTFSEVVLTLLRAKSYILQKYSNDFMVSSQSMEVDIVQTKTDCDPEEESSIQQIFAVHQLHPQLGDIPTSVRATLIFFHGFRKVPQEWRRTWMTRDNKLVWPQKWLPEDLGAENIRVLSVSFDENPTVSNNCNRHEIGENLVQSLVLSPEWKLGESGEAIFLIGHSFGGMLIKYLVTVTEARHVVLNNRGKQEVLKCEKFLERLAKIVFYSVPHASTGQEFENYVSKCRKIAPLKRSSFLQSLEGDKLFVADMNKLSTDFESALPEKLQILAFLEGKAMSKESVLVTEKSCEGASHSWQWHKIDKDNHFEVCRPNSKSHTGYRILLEHVCQHLNKPYGGTSIILDSYANDVLAQSADLVDASVASCFAKSLSFQEAGSSGSTIVRAATPEHSTLPFIDSNTPSDRSRENDDKDFEEGGVRFRENLGKFVVEYRPPRFKWKLWMGTYASVDEARRACDCARFYAGQDKGGFYFQDSPALFAELGPLNRPFTLVSRDVKDKAFNVELKRRAKLVISKDKNSQICTKNVDSTKFTVQSQSQLLEPLIREQSTGNDSCDESGVTAVRNPEQIGEGSGATYQQKEGGSLASEEGKLVDPDPYWIWDYGIFSP